MIKMKASSEPGTNFHVSSAGPDNIEAGADFTVSNEEEAKQLEAAGLAKRVGGKAEPAPENKMDAAPSNKADKPPISAKGATEKRAPLTVKKAK